MEQTDRFFLLRPLVELLDRTSTRQEVGGIYVDKLESFAGWCTIGTARVWAGSREMRSMGFHATGN